jgi:hypothetical protein
VYSSTTPCFGPIAPPKLTAGVSPRLTRPTFCRSPHSASKYGSGIIALLHEHCSPSLIAAARTQIIVNNTGLRAPPKGRFRVHTDMNRNIAVLHLVPGFSDDILHNLLQPPIEGVVIRSYGTGNAPQKKRGFLEALEGAATRGVIVVVCSQCQKVRSTTETFFP